MIWFVEEEQELTDVSYALMLEYRRTVFIPTRGIYIQSQLVSKFHWHYCPPLAEILSSLEAIVPTSAIGKCGLSGSGCGG